MENLNNEIIDTSIPEKLEKEITKVADEKDLARKHVLYNSLMNSHPLPEWVKKHPSLSVKINGKFEKLSYIPFEIQEVLVRKIFGSNVEYTVRSINNHFNGITVVARVKYTHPITGERLKMDGVASCALQMDKDTVTIDYEKIKIKALEIASPIAYTFAIKNALKKIGNIFGANLGRDINENLFFNLTDENTKISKQVLNG